MLVRVIMPDPAPTFASHAAVWMRQSRIERSLEQLFYQPGPTEAGRTRPRALSHTVGMTTSDPAKVPLTTTPGRSRNMQANRRTDTKPELALRSALHAAGLRFRKDLRLDLGSARVRPDIVFTRAKVAVFVDGCYWHCCPDHGTRPKTNADYWTPKLERNVERDREHDKALTEAGWKVVRVWEHVPVADAVETIALGLKGR